MLPDPQVEVTISLATWWKSLSHLVQVVGLEWLSVSWLNDFPDDRTSHLPQEWVFEDGFGVLGFADLMVIEKTGKQCNKVKKQQSKWESNKWNKSLKRNDVSAENQI